MKPIFSLFVFLSLFLNMSDAQESQYKDRPLGAKRPSKAYQEKREKLSLEEQIAIEKAAEANTDDPIEFEKEVPWTDTSRLFPIFIGCIVVFVLLLSYNYLMGLTADKEKILKQLEANARADEEAHRQKMLKR